MIRLLRAIISSISYEIELIIKDIKESWVFTGDYNPKPIPTYNFDLYQHCHHYYGDTFLGCKIESKKEEDYVLIEMD